MGLLIRVLKILLVVACVVLAYYITLWVLAQLGIQIPGQILNVIFVIVALVAGIYALTGGVDNLFPPKS